MKYIVTILAAVFGIYFGLIVQIGFGIRNDAINGFFGAMFGILAWYTYKSFHLKKNSADKINVDNNIYLSAMNELKENRDDAVWAKCFAENNGDIHKAEASYINKRVISLKNPSQNINDNFNKFSKYSAEDLYRNFANEEKKFKDFKYKLLKNGNVAYTKLSKDGNKIVVIYICEDDFKIAVNSSNMEISVKEVFKD